MVGERLDRSMCDYFSNLHLKIKPNPEEIFIFSWNYLFINFILFYLYESLPAYIISFQREVHIHHKVIF